ncbi:universal stress protein [soil metagenome]
MAYRKIVCATDFSDIATHALDTAIAIAKEQRCALVITNAWQLPALLYNDFVFPAEAAQQMADAAEQSLQGAVKNATKSGVPNVTSASLRGPAAQALLSFVEATPDADLVVVGTHGRGGVSRFLLGSVATHVIRHAQCSVLAVHASDALPPFASVACAIDFSDASPVAVSSALTIAGPSLRRLSLVHVTDHATGNRSEAVVEFAMRVEQRAEARLDDLVEHVRSRTSAEVVGLRRQGTPHRELLNVFETQPTPSLAVVGSHGRTGLRRIVLGSVAENVVRHAPCSVLVARER